MEERLRKLLGVAVDERTSVALITYRDRSTRFGFKYL